jgi:aminoglycoside phosphotransferase (APT) family kinase protein
LDSRTEADSSAPRGIDAPRLEPWLAAHLEGARPPFRYRLIAGGHSNLTYAVDDAAGARWVLRRPPLAAAHSGAHDMAREYRIQAALAASEVPVAPMAALCEDEAVLGAPFYVMRFVDGTVVDRPARAREALPDSAARQRATHSLVDALAALHRVDIDSVDLGTLGPRGDYVARQLSRMRRVWEKTKTRDLPIAETLHARLAECIPREPRTSLLHADFRLGNAIVDPATHRVAAVLDWELSALGDPRADLAFLLCSWDEPGDAAPGIWMEEAPTRAGGFPPREELVARYAAQTGAEVSDLDYFRALAYWRVGVIAEGIKRRYASGAMAAVGDLEAIEQRVRGRFALAERFLELSRAG